MSEVSSTKEFARNKQDRRIWRTRKMIQDAFLELMNEKSYEDITVTDLAGLAGVNRKTFYAHFESKDQLLLQMLQEMCQALFSTFMYEKAKPDEELDRDLLIRDAVCYLKKVEKYQAELDTLITVQTSRMFLDAADCVIREYMEKIHLVRKKGAGIVPAELLAATIRSFFVTSIDWWLEQTEYTAEEAAEFLAQMMRRSVTNIFRYQQVQSTGESKEESGC